MKTNGRFVSRTFSIAGLSVMFGSSLILAQETGREVAKVPFAFHARETTLPAGSYFVSSTNLGILRIADKNTGHAVMVPTRGRESGSGNPRLTFHRYGNEYFLAEIWMPDQVNGYTVSQSAREKELAKQPGQLAFASVVLQAE
jgi:hypothetical protein